MRIACHINDGQFFFLSVKTRTFAEKKWKMKKINILLILILCMTGCKKEADTTSITGEIKGLGMTRSICMGWTDFTNR